MNEKTQNANYRIPTDVEIQLFIIMDVEGYTNRERSDVEYMEDRIDILLEMMFDIKETPSKEIIRLANKYMKNRS
jgi:hypothetical protein